MRYTTTLLVAACLALSGCSASSDDEPPAKASGTVTEGPSLSDAEARQACVDDWARWYEEKPKGYDPETDPLPELPACEGRADSAELGFEALKERNEANRERLDACLEDPACSEFPIP
jgi:hypothetical protein